MAYLAFEPPAQMLDENALWRSSPTVRILRNGYAVAAGLSTGLKIACTGRLHHMRLICYLVTAATFR